MSRYGNGLIPEMILTENDFRRLFLKSRSNMWNYIMIACGVLLLSAHLTIQFFSALSVGVFLNHAAFFTSATIFLMLVLVQHIARLYFEREALAEFEWDWYENCAVHGSNLDAPNETVGGDLPLRYVKWMRGTK